MANTNTTVRNQQRGGIVGYFRNVKAEMKKVVWPKKKELINSTVVVFVTVLFISLIIGGVDAVFSRLFRLLLQVVG